MLHGTTAAAMFSTLTRWLFLSLLALQCFPAQAQVNQSARIEIPLLKDRDDTYDIIPAQERGLFLFKRYASTNIDQIEIIHLDTGFQTVWRGYLPIEKKLMLMGKKAQHNKLFMLFQSTDYTRKDFQLLAIEEKSGDYIQYPVRNFINFSPTEFQPTDSAVIIGGYFNRVPVVIHFSFKTQRSRMLPGLLNESGELTQIKTYLNGDFDVLISARNIKGMQTIWIKNYSAEGELIRNYPLEPEENRNLIFARSIQTENNMQLVAGVYGLRKSEYSRGLFIASLDPTGLQQLRYYNFGDLENFFKYMKAKREQRIKERIERKKIKGKLVKFNYRFLVHEIVPYHDQYVLLGEAFYPRYVSMDRSMYSGFFSPYTFSRGMSVRDGRIFDGYYYTHAVVMGFDRNGNLLWDNSFEINDIKTYTLEQFVKLEVHDDKIVLLYLFENEFRSKIIKGNEVLEGKSREPVKTKGQDDVVKNESNNVVKLDYWYQDYFFAYGVQEVANPLLGKRRVFFINKVSYD